jgi:membrane protein
MADKRWTGRLERLVQNTLRIAYVSDVLALAVRLQPIDRALALASKLFVAVIPLSIVLTAVVPGTKSFGETLVDRFGLTGSGADATEALFATKGEVQGGVTIFGLIVVLYSMMSFARGLQRVYQDAWDLPPLGVDGLRRRGLWILGFVVYLAVGSPLRRITEDHDLDLLYVIVVLGMGSILWVWTPYELIGRRLHWRRLLPLGVLTAVATSAYTAISAIYIPRLFSTSAERYGLIGVAFSIVTWLFVFASVIVGSVIVFAAFDRRRNGPPIADVETLFRQAVE